MCPCRLAQEPLQAQGHSSQILTSVHTSTPLNAQHWGKPTPTPTPRALRDLISLLYPTNKCPHLCAHLEAPTERTQCVNQDCGCDCARLAGSALAPRERSGRFPLRALTPWSSHVGHLLSCLEAAFAKLKLDRR